MFPSGLASTTAEKQNPPKGTGLGMLFIWKNAKIELTQERGRSI
jgi:hypothetical protein